MIHRVARPLLPAGLALLLLLAAAQGGRIVAQPAGAQGPLKVFISVDMEGVNGVTSGEHTSPEGRDHAIGRRLMVGEANAAIQGALAAGATDVLVADSHSSMINMDPAELMQDARVRLVTGRPRPLGMMEGLDETFAAAVYIGYHARAGTADAVHDHTWTGTVTGVRVNGTSVGEYGINALIAGHFGVPVVFISGDQAAVDQARSFIPGIRGLGVKQGIGRTAANTMLPGPAQAGIEAGVRDAVAARAAVEPIRPSLPLRLEVSFTTSALADTAARFPRAERVDAYTVGYTAQDALEMSRAFRAMFCCLEGREARTIIGPEGGSAMAQLLISGTHGPDDPTRASLPFHVGKGAIDAGHQVAVALMGDATYLMKDPIRQATFGVAMPPLSELFQFAVDHKVPVYV